MYSDKYRSTCIVVIFFIYDYLHRTAKVMFYLSLGLPVGLFVSNIIDNA